MEICQISVAEHLPKTLVTTLKASESHIAKTSDNEAALFVTDELNENLFHSDHSLFAIAKNPKVAVTKLQEAKEPDGVPIFTIVGESRLLHSRQTAQSISLALKHQGYLSEEQEPAYRMVLQEIILNSIEHGNLDLSGVKEEQVNRESWFKTYHHILEQRLNSKRGDKCVTIQCSLEEGALVTSIEDEGYGFNFKKTLLNKEKTESKPYGKGLMLAQSLADSFGYEKEGSKCYFTFKTNFVSDLNIEGIAAISRNSARAQGRVLIVDDQASNREFAKFYLTTSGYNHIAEAADGEEALEKALTFNPDIILLDIIMPHLDGFTVCRRLKQNPKTARIPILFLSGLTDIKSRIKGYRLGAVDYVNKPIDKNELVARADIHIQNGMMLHTLNNYSQRIQQELEKAEKYQHNLLPTERELQTLSKKHALHIEHLFKACDNLAGDYWHIFPIDEDNVAMLMADFTGHGVTAALNTVYLHAISFELRKYAKNPIKFCDHLNQKLCNLLNIGNFATFAYGILNSKTGKFSYVGCGTPPIALIPENKRKAPSLLDCAGVPLGLVPSSEAKFTVRETTLEAGDHIFFYSDALCETAHGKDAKMWEENQLISVLKDCRKGKDGFTLEKLLSNFYKTAQTPLKDDLTLLTVQFKA